MDNLMPAFSRIRWPDATLAIVGWDHSAIPALRALGKELGIESRVIFCGPILGDERFTAYVDADVFALPPRVFEETSLAALVAAACGCPTALPPECEIPGLTASGVGLLMENTIPSIAASVESLTDADFRRTVGRRGREYVHQNFSVQTVATDHERLFAKLLA